MLRSILERFAKPHLVIGTSAAVAVLSVAAVFVLGSIRPNALYIAPTQGSISEEVDATGTVKPAESIDLSFDTSGKIARVAVAVGDHVVAGQTLATLNGADLYAQVEQAKASFAMQQAKLTGLQAGATPTALAASETSVANAQSALSQAKQSVLQASADAYVKADDAIHNKVDQFLNNPRSLSPTLLLTLNNSQLQQTIVSGRVSMEALLNEWQAYEASFPSDPNAIDASSVADKTHVYLTQVSAYLDQVAAGLTGAIPNTNYSSATIQSYQSNIATARTNISADATAFNTAEAAEKSAESTLASAQAQLNVTRAPTTPTDIAAQQAAVQSARASVDAAQANLAKTVISAPISGTITVNNAHVGQTASPGAALISLNSDAQFQIESYVSELDFAKLKAGDEAQVGLDAYPSAAPLPAHVIAIDPAATMQSGVASYKITLQFDSNDPSEKAGLTANLKIITATKQSALSVPTSAIITQGTQKYVMKEIGGTAQLTSVTIGISSAGGMTEILSGLSTSDKVRTFGAQ